MISLTKNRASIIHNIYVTKKYKSDPEFRKKIRETNNRAKRAYDARQRLKKLEKSDETKND